MSGAQMSPPDQARYDEIVCIADTKLVLAGWHMITLPNGRAIADCTEAIRLAPDGFQAYALRGALFERQGEKDEAVADYRRALSLEPRAAEASDGLRRLGVAR